MTWVAHFDNPNFFFWKNHIQKESEAPLGCKKEGLMAQQVGKGHTINLTASLRAGTRALEEMRSQGHISTSNWYRLTAGPIDNNPVNNPIGRKLVFVLETEQRIEVSVMTWRQLGETVKKDGERKWFPCHVYLQEGSQMLSFENYVNLGGYPWSRQPKCDKPLHVAV